jgi:hypothetical protein
MEPEGGRETERGLGRDGAGGREGERETERVKERISLT